METPDGMLLIPAGEFLMGNDWKDVKLILRSAPCLVRWQWLLSRSIRGLMRSQCPKHIVTLPAYFIDRYPVTNEQYKAFVDATGHRVPYVPRDWAEPYNWDSETKDFPEGKAKHPVTMVSWHDAQACCSWAGKRLPTEAEWERAARGTGGRYWPWGNEGNRWLANTREAGPRETTPVGAYQKNVSPDGCVDMAGNIKEWCADDYDLEPAFQVVRGGGWSNYIALASCSFREARHPDVKNESLGFRCALSAEGER